MTTMRTCMLLLLLLMVKVEKAEADGCNIVLEEPNGTIPESSPANESCTYIIKKNSTTVLKINQVSLRDNDTLVIYDGNRQQNKTIASYTAQSKAEFRVAVSLIPNVTIVFMIDGNSTKSAWSLSYDTKECNVTINNSWISRVDSPLYVPTRSKDLNCTYIVNSDALPSDHKAVASLSSLQMMGNSSLTVSNRNSSITYKNDSSKDDFFAQDTNTFVVAISITNASIPQSFSLLIGAVVSECSGTVLLTTPFSWPQLPAQSVGYECRLLFHTNGSGSVILANISSLHFASNSDRLTFIDGGSSNGQILATVTNDVKDYLVTGSPDSMIVSLMVGSTDGPRSIDLTLAEAAYGGRFTSQRSFGFQNKADNFSVYYHLIASQGQMVNVEVLSDLPEGSTVTFYNGLQLSDSKLFVLRHGAQNLKNVIGGANMLVELSDFSTGSNFNASFTSIQPGCNLLATGSSGHISYSAQSGQICTLTISPQDITGTIIMNMDSLSLEDGVTVKVYSGLHNLTLLAQFTGPLEAQMYLLQIDVPVIDGVSIVVTRDANVSVARVDFHYQTVQHVCGEQLKVPADSILTPNYPNQYPLNAHCVWYPGNNTTQFLYLSFQDLALAQNHTISIVDITNETSKVIATYGGIRQSPDHLPADLVENLTSGLQIEFQSSQSLQENIIQVGRGVNITSIVMDCGGKHSGTGAFTTSGYPQALTKSSFCVWIVETKGKPGENTTNIVNFTIEAVSPNVLDQYVKIYDGNSSRASLLSINVTKTEGILSRYDTVVVVLNYTSGIKPIQAGLSFSFSTKECHLNELCNNGVCLHADWKCNGFDDCGDNTDERNCLPPTPSPPHPQDSGLVKSGWIPACLFIGVLLGAILVFTVPKIMRRLRARGANYSRMGDNTSDA